MKGRYNMKWDSYWYGRSAICPYYVDIKKKAHESDGINGMCTNYADVLTRFHNYPMNINANTSADLYRSVEIALKSIIKDLQM